MDHLRHLNIDRVMHDKLGKIEKPEQGNADSDANHHHHHPRVTSATLALERAAQWRITAEYDTGRSL
jgi:hypothetical protein